MSCMVPVNSTVASERAWEALLRRREEKMALTPIKLVAVSDQHGLATAVICVSSLAVSDQHGRGWRSPVSNLEWTAWASSNSVASRVTSVAD